MHHNLPQVTEQTCQAFQELLSQAKLEPGHILVIGCSTSEVRGKKIGASSSLQVAQAILAGVLPYVREHQLFLAVQGCEHINRALAVEKACARENNLEIVSVVPHLGAGGGMVTAAFQAMDDPVMVESIRAHAGMDIGDTFIGMHLKRVVVPVRSTILRIGEAHLTMARTRPMLVGGERARYSGDMG